MSYVTCNACPVRSQCDEAGMCLNTLVTHRYHSATDPRVFAILPAGSPDPFAVGIDDPALAQHPIALANAASWPTGKAPPRPAKAPPSVAAAPGAGSVTERIFAACDSRVGAGPVDRAMLEAARKAAIPYLEAAGVNINSARKGSSMWLQARLASL